MSKYIVTNSSHFKPFTYDELVKPIAQYTEAYNKSVEDTDALAMQAGAIGSMIDDKSTVARGLYDSFMSDTEGLVDDLASNGYNINTANQLSNLRRRYGQDITKINAAITNKAAAVKRYDDELSKDKTLITQIDPRTLSVDDWMENPYAGNYKSYSGTMLLTQASSLGENLRRDLLQNADKWKSILGGQYFERDTFTGFHANEIDKAISLLNKGEVSNDSRIATLQNAMMTVYNSSGMSEWASPEQRAQALGYIGEGIYSAVGSHKSDTLKNSDYIDAYHRIKLGGSGNQNYQPPIVAVRGSKLTGNGDPEGNTVLQALSAFNTLVKTNSHVDDKGNMTPAASAALRTLAQNKKEFQELTGIELTPELLSGDISQIITDAAKKISESATNDSYYNMQTTPGAAQNIVTNIFRLNIDDLSAQGRKGRKAADSKAGAIAHYSDGKQLTAGELSEILDSKNISVGFDAKTGELIIKKTGSESGEKTGQFNDRKVYLDPNNPKKAWPVNYERNYAGHMTIRQALSKSRNTIAAEVWTKVGGETALWYLKQVGIDRTSEGAYPSQSVGGFGKGMTTLEMAAAYATFASGGTYTSPYAYTKVLDSEGKLVIESKPLKYRVYSKETCFLLTDILKDVVTSGWVRHYGGQIKNSKGKQIDAAGKTGTTSDNNDKWFCGFTNYYSAAVWYGYDNRLKQTKIPKTDYHNAGRIWEFCMKNIHKDLPASSFKKPANVVKVSYCTKSGMYPNSICKDEKKEDKPCKVHVTPTPGPAKTPTPKPEQNQNQDQGGG